MSKRKYKKGTVITSMNDLLRQEFVFWHDKVYHQGFWQSWQFRFVKEQLEKGLLYTAEDIEEIQQLSTFPDYVRKDAKIFFVPKEWLKKTVEENNLFWGKLVYFLDFFTWEDSRFIYEKAKAEGKIIREKEI